MVDEAAAAGPVVELDSTLPTTALAEVPLMHTMEAVPRCPTSCAAVRGSASEVESLDCRVAQRVEVVLGVVEGARHALARLLLPRGWHGLRHRYICNAGGCPCSRIAH